MYENTEFYTDARLAGKIGVLTSTIERWRRRGMIPPHDVMLEGGGAYLGRTLNQYMRIAEAVETGRRA